MENRKVFISYSFDSAVHKERVFDLSERLRVDGVDSQIDQYETSPLEGWPRWTRNQIKDADYVLVICTEKYERRYEGIEESGVGVGAKWEGVIITQQLYESEGNVHKFIPVVFRREDANHIPVELRGSTYYALDEEEGYECLYRHITGQPEAVKGVLGKLKSLPTKKRKQDFSNDVAHATPPESVDLELEQGQEQREIYSDAINVEKAEEILNIDLLEKILDSLLPPENKKGNEQYATLLEDLQHFNITTSEKLKDLIKAHLHQILESDRRRVERLKRDMLIAEGPAKQTGTDAERLERGVSYTHGGLIREAMDARFGQEWQVYLAEKYR